MHTPIRCIMRSPPPIGTNRLPRIGAQVRAFALLVLIATRVWNCGRDSTSQIVREPHENMAIIVGDRSDHVKKRFKFIL